MTTEKTNKWAWDKPVFPSDNIASELTTLIGQIDSDVGNLPPYINDLQVGEGGNRDYHYESTNPAGFALDHSPKQNANSYSRIKVENNTASEVTETVTQSRYVGTDNTGTLDWDYSETLTVPANDYQFWYVGDGARLDKDTYFWEVTSANSTFDITDTRLYFHNYFHNWTLTNDGSVQFSTTQNTASPRDIMRLDGQDASLLFNGNKQRGVTVSAETLAYSDMLRIQNQGDDFTILELEAPDDGGQEATLSLTRHDPDGTPHFLDIFNNGYSDSQTFGFRMQTRGGGTLKPFKFQFNDGVEAVYDRLNVPPKGSPVEVFEGLDVDGKSVDPESLYSGNSDAYVFESGGVYRVLVDGQEVYNGTDPVAAIQTAIDDVSSLSAGTVTIGNGTYEIDSTVTVKEGITLLQGKRTYIKNTQTDEFSPTFAFKKNTDIPRFELDANGGSGVVFGEPYTPANVTIGDLNVYNASTTYANGQATFGVKLQGYNINYDHFHIVGGNRGLEVTGAGDIFGHSGIVIQAAVGVSVGSSEHLVLKSLDIDSCTYQGMVVNSTNDLRTDATIWNNADEYPNSLGVGVVMGQYGKCTQIISDTTHIGHGGTGLHAYDVSDSSLTVSMTNGGLNTTTQTIQTGVHTESAVEDSVEISGDISGISTSLIKGGGTFDIEGVTRTSGSSTFSGDGTQTIFTVPHGLGYTPSSLTELLVSGSATSTDSQSGVLVSADPIDSGTGTADSMRFVFSNPPPSGTDNVSVTWSAKLL
jgi:hypothetical protein